MDINSNKTFTDAIAGIKKTHNPITTVVTIKTKGNTKIKHLLPEDDLKRQKHMLKKNYLKADYLVDLFILNYLFFPH